MRNLAHGCRGKYRSFIFFYFVFIGSSKPVGRIILLYTKCNERAQNTPIFDTGPGEYRTICPIFHRLK